MGTVARGRMAYCAGEAAEQRIALDYERRGFTVARRRWRGAGGEIDLIVRDDRGLVFVEVKQSRSLSRAAQRLSARQMQRLASAAEEFAGTEPMGLLTDMRFDVALVDGTGRSEIIENAICAA